MPNRSHTIDPNFDIFLLFNKFKGEFGKLCDQHEYNQYIKPLRMKVEKNNTLVLEGTFEQISYFRSNCLHTFVNDHFDTLKNKKILLADEEIDVKSIINSEQDLSRKNLQQTTSKNHKLGTFFSSQHDPNHHYSLDGFVKGDCNRKAVALAQRIIDNPGHFKHNPAYIYGAPSAGKTHLMLAIRNALMQKNIRTLYITAADYVRKVSEAGRLNLLDRLSADCYRYQVLLFDDLHWLAKGKKEFCKDELTKITAYMLEKQLQVVFSSTLHPSQLFNLKQLQQKIEGVLAVQIERLDQQTSRALTVHYCQKYKMKVSEQVLEKIASHFLGNARTMEGLIRSIHANCENKHEELSWKSYLDVAERFYTEEIELPSFEKILQVVAEHFALSVDVLKSESRRPRVTNARAIALFLIRAAHKLSYAELGEIVGRTHSTVQRAIGKLQTMQRTGASSAIAIEVLRRKLNI